MLKAGFLKTLSDYVSEIITHETYLMDKEAGVFNLREYIEKDENEAEKFLGLFSEWLVFDKKQAIWQGLTGLEYFVKYNPLDLPAEEVKNYRDLLGFEVGYFEVKEVETGRGVLLESVATGDEYFVNDINASMSVKKEDTLWTRIASVSGRHHMVGSIFFVMPIKIMPGMRKDVAGWKKNSFDAKEIAKWLAPSASENRSDKKRIFAGNRDKTTYEEVEKDFVEALKRCCMDTMFSVKTYKKWIVDEDKFGVNFANRALFCLTPRNIKEEDFSFLLDAAINFANFIPRKFLNGRTPAEASAERKEGEKGMVEMDTISRDKYIENLERAQELMKDLDYKKAYKTLEGVIRDLLEDRTPFYDAFRIYANSAVCCFADQNPGLGEELLRAALRINSHYDFANRVMELEVEPYKDSSKVPKKDRIFYQAMGEIVKNNGIRNYKRTVFRKYEDFLKKIGVSLNYETETKVTTYSKNGEKIGRNDPCYCGSNKKFKKCHGV